MANLVFNVAKGRGIQLLKNVKDDSPAASVVRIYAIVAGAATDDELRDADTMSAVFATAAAEATNSGYAQITDDGTDLTLTLDDTGNTYDAILTDQTWTSVSAGDDWTDIIVAYDPDGLGTAASCIPISLHDFVVSPNGGNITADFPATAFYEAA
jgi:hypothetical protein